MYVNAYKLVEDEEKAQAQGCDGSGYHTDVIAVIRRKEANPDLQMHLKETVNVVEKLMMDEISWGEYALLFFRGYSLKEIAEVMVTTPQTVKRRIAWAIKEFGQKFSREDVELLGKTLGRDD